MGQYRLNFLFTYIFNVVVAILFANGAENIVVLHFKEGSQALEIVYVQPAQAQALWED